MLSSATPKELEKYAKHFAKLPGGKSGAADAESALKLLGKAKLPRDAVRAIFDAHAGAGARTIGRDAFCAAMHETYAAIKGAGGKTPASFAGAASAVRGAGKLVAAAPGGVDFGSFDTPEAEKRANRSRGGFGSFADPSDFGGFGGGSAAAATSAASATSAAKVCNKRYSK